jgi:hypothetical protein
MSVRPTQQEGPTAGSAPAAQPGLASPRTVGGDHGYGWILFAAVLLFLVGSANMIEGLGAIDGSNFFQRHAHYIIGDLTAFGWIILAIGVCQYVAGVAVLLKNQLARWFGAATFAVGAVVELLSLPQAPFWSLTIVALNVLGLYGLLVYGEHITDR